jgi:hypothetical protein
MRIITRLTKKTKNAATYPAGAFDWLALEKDRFLELGNQEMAWKKYCGFFDFSIDEFISIQNQLLTEQIEIWLRFPLSQEIMGGFEPENITAFRRFAPLTVYADYRAWFENPAPLALHEPALFWAENTRANGPPTRIPFSLSGLKALVDDMITALILSSAGAKGEVCLKPVSRMLIVLPVKSLSRAINIAIGQRLECLNLTAACADSEALVDLDRNTRQALDKGLDFIIAEPSAIAQLGHNIGYSTIRRHFTGRDPAILLQLIKAWWIDSFLHRPVLASDIWQIKGIVACGDGTAGYTEQIAQTWGTRPLAVFSQLEGGFLAVQGWNKKGLTFIPYRNFYEFIPLSEIQKEAVDQDYQPATLLMNELKSGEIYELVITNFHGGPFLRYRLGEYLKVIALNDPQTGVNLPQFAVCDLVELPTAAQ